MTGPTRRLFQIHLSTAVVLVLSAGGVLWANAIPRITSYPSNTMAASAEYGWPMNCYVDGVGPLPKTLKSAGLWNVWNCIHWGGATTNVIVAAISLLVSTFACELLIRRREARKP